MCLVFSDFPRLKCHSRPHTRTSSRACACDARYYAALHLPVAPPYECRQASTRRCSESFSLSLSLSLSVFVTITIMHYIFTRIVLSSWKPARAVGYATVRGPTCSAASRPRDACPTVFTKADCCYFCSFVRKRRRFPRSPWTANDRKLISHSDAFGWSGSLSDSFIISDRFPHL